MEKILQSLYYGELLPAEQYLPRIAEFKEMRQNHYRHYEEIHGRAEKAGRAAGETIH